MWKSTSLKAEKWPLVALWSPLYLLGLVSSPQDKDGYVAVSQAVLVCVCTLWEAAAQAMRVRVSHGQQLPRLCVCVYPVASS